MKYQVKYQRKKIIVLCGMLALIAAVSVVNNRLSVNDSLNASAGYADYEVEQMQQHDGEILVDSINVRELPGTNPDSSNPDAIGEAGTAENSDAAETMEYLDDPEIYGGAEVVTSDNIEELSNSDAYFSEVRATINMDRNEIIAMLTSVIEESEEGPAKNNATEQKLKIIEYMNLEKTIENLVVNKGFPECLVLITDSSVNVTVNKQELSQSDAAKIYDIVMRETGRPADQIVLQTKF